MKPKRNLSAYLLFANEHMKMLREKSDGKTHSTDLMKMTGSKWTELSEQEKAKYETLAEPDKARYER